MMQLVTLPVSTEKPGLLALPLDFHSRVAASLFQELS